MKLITFGCSLTAGYGLDDVGINPKVCSQFSWPIKLGKLLDCDVDNQGSNGASNKEIQWNVLNYNFHRSDIVVILWSHKDRWCIINEKPQQVNAWNKDKTSKMFFKFLHTDTDMSIDLHTRIQSVDMFLSKKNIKSFHAYADIDYKKNYNWFDIKTLNVDMGEIRRTYPKAKYDHHPGIEAHDVFATEVYKEIRNKL